MGFGAHSRIHTAKLLELSQDLPIVIEIVDAPEKIEAFMPDLEAMVGDGLITLERATMLLCPARQILNGPAQTGHYAPPRHRSSSRLRA